MTSKITAQSGHGKSSLNKPSNLQNQDITPQLMPLNVSKIPSNMNLNRGPNSNRSQENPGLKNQRSEKVLLFDKRGCQCSQKELDKMDTNNTNTQYEQQLSHPDKRETLQLTKAPTGFTNKNYPPDVICNQRYQPSAQHKRVLNVLARVNKEIETQRYPLNSSLTYCRFHLSPEKSPTMRNLKKKTIVKFEDDQQRQKLVLQTPSPERLPVKQQRCMTSRPNAAAAASANNQQISSQLNSQLALELSKLDQKAVVNKRKQVLMLMHQHQKHLDVKSKWSKQDRFLKIDPFTAKQIKNQKKKERLIHIKQQIAVNSPENISTKSFQNLVTQEFGITSTFVNSLTSQRTSQNNNQNGSNVASPRCTFGISHDGFICQPPQGVSSPGPIYRPKPGTFNEKKKHPMSASAYKSHRGSDPRHRRDIKLSEDLSFYYNPSNPNSSSYRPQNTQNTNTNKIIQDDDQYYIKIQSVENTQTQRNMGDSLSQIPSSMRDTKNNQNLTSRQSLITTTRPQPYNYDTLVQTNNDESSREQDHKIVMSKLNDNTVEIVNKNQTSLELMTPKSKKFNSRREEAQHVDKMWQPWISFNEREAINMDILSPRPQVPASIGRNRFIQF